MPGGNPNDVDKFTTFLWKVKTSQKAESTWQKTDTMKEATLTLLILVPRLTLNHNQKAQANSWCFSKVIKASYGINAIQPSCDWCFAVSSKCHCINSSVDEITSNAIINTLKQMQCSSMISNKYTIWRYTSCTVFSCKMQPCLQFWTQHQQD